MAAGSLRTVMEKCVMASIDAKRAMAIHRMEREFVNRNEDHSAFFGGNLIGVHTVRFLTTDREYWLSEIADCDEFEIDDAMKALAKAIDDPTVLDTKWVRANDAVNLTMLYIAHRYMIEKKLPIKVSEQAAVDAIKLLMYKYFTSILSHWFRYPADEEVMQAAYAEMSRKFAIKKSGSWGAFFEQRAREFVTAKNIHIKTMRTFEDTKAVIYVVSDIQTRLKGIVMAIATVFYRVRDQGSRIIKSKSIDTFNGEEVLVEKQRQLSGYQNYIQDIIDDRHSFLKDELIDVVADAMHTVPPRYIKDALTFISVNYHVPKYAYMASMVNELLIHAFEVIASDRTLYGKNSSITTLITRLRALYMASRMSDPVLLKIKEQAAAIVKASVSSKTAAIHAGVRTAIQVYIVLRTLSKQHYQN